MSRSIPCLSSARSGSGETAFRPVPSLQVPDGVVCEARRDAGTASAVVQLLFGLTCIVGVNGDHHVLPVLLPMCSAREVYGVS